MSELVRVRVKTDATKDAISETKGILQVNVIDTPERNAANRKVVALVRAYKKVKRVEIVSGHHKRTKVLRIT